MVPVANVVSTLVIVLVPVLIGMLVRRKSLGMASKLEKAGGAVGIVVIVFLVATWIPRNSHLLAETSGASYLAALLLGVAGYVLGFGSSRLVGLPLADAKTVALETGIQNTPLTFAIILSSLPETSQAETLWLPLLYAPGVVITSCLATLVFRSIRVGSEAPSRS